MTEMIKCPQCDGCGQVADNYEGEPWSVWKAEVMPALLAVIVGIVGPVDCDSCNGLGETPWPTV